MTEFTPQELYATLHDWADLQDKARKAQERPFDWRKIPCSCGLSEECEDMVHHRARHCLRASAYDHCVERGLQ